MDDDAIDFAIAAWREDGRWSVEALPPRATESLEQVVAALRQLGGEGGALGFVSVAEEFFVAVRAVPDGTTRLLLSDLNAAYDWPLAQEAADALGIEVPQDEEELDVVEPAGDPGFAADLGLHVADVELLCEDADLYPDEQVASLAARLGFGDQFAAVVDSRTR